MKRVWLVDDSPLSLETVGRQLGPDHAIEVFTDGSSVIERAAHGELPDVLLLDWHMPGVSGNEVLRFLRADPRTEGLPILVLTGTANDLDLVEALEAGADDYVAKPCSRAELAARIGSLVRSKELRERAESAEREIADLLTRERAARAEAESANEVKDDFLATLSHELRTPLNSILGWTSLLRGGTLAPDTAARALATIERNAKAQASIIDDLLDISRIVSGKLRLEVTEIDPADPTEQALETVRPTAASKKVELYSHIGKTGRIAGDAARIQQIVWNLLTNAIRFTPAGGSITVDLEMARDGVVLSVTDTGEGIAPELLPRVFDRFKQGDSTSTRSHGGLGLGLAIVRHMTELHGGHVRALSPGRGHGARFEVWLPLASPPEDRSPIATPGMVTSLRGVNVLVVDDDADSLDLVCSALTMEGATVTSASSATAALSSFDRKRPDVLVFDIMMPDMDGYALMRAVRARDEASGAPRIPGIAVTAAARDEDRAKAFAAGFQFHVPKPLDMAVLTGTVARAAAEKLHGI